MCATTVRSGSAPSRTTSRACLDPPASHASPDLKKYLTHGSATCLGRLCFAARERVPPRDDRPAVAASCSESRDVRGGGPDPAPGGHDNMRREASQGSEGPFRHVQVAVEAGLEAGTHSHPREIKRPGVEGDVLAGQVGLGLPTSVALHRSLGDEEKLDVLALRDPVKERSQVRSHRADDDGDPRGPGRKYLRQARHALRGRIRVGHRQPSDPRLSATASRRCARACTTSAGARRATPLSIRDLRRASRV